MSGTDTNQGRRFLLWDHDGVLVDSERWYFAATRQGLSSLGVALDQPTYLRFMARGRSCWDLAREVGVGEEAIESARQRRDQLYRRHLEEEEIEVPGVLEVLERLRGRYRMGVVSTARRTDLELIHQRRRILSAFEFVVTIEDCLHPKPHPAPYLEGLRRFGAEPAQAIAIEDSSRGLQSAVSAGIDCVVVRSDFTASQDFTGAWKVIASLVELPSALA